MEEEKIASQAQINCPVLESFPKEQNTMIVEQDKLKQQKTLNESEVISMRVRNRRFKKLKQLRAEGFFNQQAIKLRHPFLYYLFVGQYDYDDEKSLIDNQREVNLFSSFLEKNLMNVQYKKLLSEQMSDEVQKILEVERNMSEDEIKKVKKMFAKEKTKQFIKQMSKRIEEEQSRNTQMQIESKYKQQVQKIAKDNLLILNPTQQEIEKLRSSISLSNKKSSIASQLYEQQSSTNSLFDPQMTQQLYQKFSHQRKLSPQEKQLQQQHLIQYCQQLFLQGKLSPANGIHYQEIDQNQEYDDLEEETKDCEQRYFNQIQQQMDQEAQNFYTGIQDF